jgi:YD repeat-containing protein
LTRSRYISVTGESAPIVVTTTIVYGYDPLYRLVEATYSSGEVYTYTYDQVGNRLARAWTAR